MADSVEGSQDEGHHRPERNERRHGKRKAKDEEVRGCVRKGDPCKERGRGAGATRERVGTVSADEREQRLGKEYVKFQGGGGNRFLAEGPSTEPSRRLPGTFQSTPAGSPSLSASPVTPVTPLVLGALSVSVAR